MQIKTSLSAFAAIALSVAFNASPVAALPAGTIALQDWFIDVLPKVFPNCTDNWQGSFEDGTINQNIHLQFNTDPATDGLLAMRARWNATNTLITSRTSRYVVDITGVAAYTTDFAEGKSGYIVGTGRTWLKTKEGKKYFDGVASTYLGVEWDEEKQKRTIVEWREVNSPPNFPYYPWSDTPSPN